ncbi:hypothetical protein T472_0201105 [Youngiibacter fragilis 232.1]|uniref:Uncharacterized protein n=1 Tax=Youngiibacter fragilis 232.1 TaxID=994573 RepID=V7IAX2_9CLOT|nr:hypothetical protein T472_0201105 [Youngiibacter fragilis 232.1]
MTVKSIGLQLEMLQPFLFGSPFSAIADCFAFMIEWMLKKNYMEGGST